jgi:RimJ/RimL family protein N-acetyltransferase
VNKRYNDTTKDYARIMLAVTLKDTGTIIGMVGIGNKKEVDNQIEIAYFVSEKYSGNGYISEAAIAMAEWTLKTLGLEYLIAIVEPDNYPSQRIVEKCGFKKLETRMILNSGETEEKPFFYYRLYNTSNCN